MSDDYSTWNWDSIDAPSGIKVIPVTSTIITPSEAGYDTCRPRWTRNRMKIVLEWSGSEGMMSPASFNALLEFFWNRRGPALPFYFQVPVGLYGSPDGYSGEADPSGLDPFDTEVDVGYGEGPVYLVRFTQEELPFRFLFPNHWYTESPVELLKVA